MRVEPIDDLALLMSQLAELGLESLFDQHYPSHRNWKGASVGKVFSGWLLYLLSESDHRLSHVEDWADSRLLVLRGLLDQADLRSLDFSDDRLGRLLDRLSQDDPWREFEKSLGKSMIRVYELLAPEKASAGDMPPVIRSDSFNAPQFRQPTELFRFGHSKQRRKDCPQCKVMVSALDPFAIPLSVEIVAGNGSDYPYYLPVINRARHILDRSGCLYVGDSHLGSIANRDALNQAGDYYLCPLNRKHCTPTLIDSYLAMMPTSIEQLPGIGLRPNTQGHASYFFELDQPIEMDQEQDQWSERRILCYSVAYATRLQQLFDQRLEQAQVKIEQLVQNKSGRRNPKTLAELNGRIAKLIARFGVEGCFEIHTAQQIECYQVGKYKDRPAEQRQTIHLSLTIKRLEEQIESQRRKKGWQVYATNAPKALVSTQQVVECYQKEYRIEHLFDYLINRDLGLLPLYLKKEHRIKALIRLLSVAMRVSCALQTSVRRRLKQKNESIKGIYPGNKGRQTTTPTTPMILRAMKGIALAIFEQTASNLPMISERNHTQITLLQLLTEHDPYQQLLQKIISASLIRET